MAAEQEVAREVEKVAAQEVGPVAAKVERAVGPEASKVERAAGQEVAPEVEMASEPGAEKAEDVVME